MSRAAPKYMNSDAKLVSNKLLRFFVQKLSRKEYLDSAVKEIGLWTGCCCVGIRILDVHGYIPYESCIGFSGEFLEKESMLSIESDECACIRVIRGEFVLADQAALTQQGSFHCEDSTRFVGGLTEEQKTFFRGTCVETGFKSICIVPIGYRDEILGAIHLADKREGIVPRNAVETIESIALMAGEAVFRYKLEKALEESENRYRTLIENALSGIYLVQDGKIVFANEAFAKIHGYSIDEIMGIDSVNIVHPEDRHRVEEIRQKRLRGEESPTEYEIRGVTKGGDTIWVQRRNVLIRYDGKASVLGYEVDIKDRKRAEEALRASEKELRFLSARLLTAQEEERKKISHDLHDSIGHSLVTIKMEVENMIQNFDQNTPDLLSLKNILSISQEALGETRSIIGNLRPAAIDHLGLLVAISSLCKHSSTASRIEIQEEHNLSEEDIPESLKILIYRILQEALNNVIKHSGADRVQVSLNKVGGSLELAVEDDGIGFDVSETLSRNEMKKGIGLASMKERANLSGGTFFIDSSTGQGTKVRAVWPLMK